MKLGRWILWDMRFQIRYGFYFLYAVLTILYSLLLLAVPGEWKKMAAAVLTFSDPAAMGLFFMGAIVLLEKSQHLPCLYAVSPIFARTYVVAKVVSLGAISLVVAFLLEIAAKSEHLLLVTLGTGCAFVLFTLPGIIAATKVKSLNQFLLWTVPIEMIGFVPGLLYLFGILPKETRFFPVNFCVDLISGNSPSAAGGCLYVLTTGILAVICCKCVEKMWGSAGGVKL